MLISPTTHEGVDKHLQHVAESILLREEDVISGYPDISRPRIWTRSEIEGVQKGVSLFTSKLNMHNLLLAEIRGLDLNPGYQL